MTLTPDPSVMPIDREMTTDEKLNWLMDRIAKLDMALSRFLPLLERYEKATSWRPFQRKDTDA